MKVRSKKIFLLLGILYIGVFFRFINLNWDQGFHLHPDERFLTMVGNAIVQPKSLMEYLDPKKSLFNPANVGFPFFVYGTLPLVFNKLIATFLHTDNYYQFTIQGRILSAFFDLLVIVFVFKTVELFEEKYSFSKKAKYFASFFYAISILPIQLSHFFAVDTFLNFFAFSSFYYSVKFSYHSKIRFVLISAILLGFAIASKISAVVIIPLILFFLIKDFTSLKKTPYILTRLFMYGLTCYFSIRLTDPYLFETGNIFNPQISSLFLQNIHTLSSWSNKDIWFPPTVQWITKPPILFSLVNLAVFGIGIPYFTLLLLGIYSVLRKLKTDLLVVVVWLILFFLFQSIQFAKPMRYLIIMYPFIAIIAGFGYEYATKNLKNIYKIFAITFVLAYPLLFVSIYIEKNTRVNASGWIYQNIPSNSTILTEHWDDYLPLPLTTYNGIQFKQEILPVFDIDSNEKMKKITSSLKKADYYILSSNRAWGSIPTVPEKYPLMSKFYKNLFAEKLGYKKIKEFTSYPSLKYLGIPIELNDDWADESFTVYDHSKVIIFQKINFDMR